eukprot:20717-Heterococcus_DN1.PRE.3
MQQRLLILHKLRHWHAILSNSRYIVNERCDAMTRDTKKFCCMLCLANAAIDVLQQTTRYTKRSSIMHVEQQQARPNT